MSVHKVPYQLRINKFVERQLFLDTLDFVRVWNGPSDYAYISMGGPFLEDFRHVNERLAIENMVSLESDKLTWERQLFNAPFGFIDCRNESTSEFVTNFDAFAAGHSGKRFIIWLDYSGAGERFEQLQELESLVAKLGPGDVFKITLNANYQSAMRRSEFKGISDKQFDLLLINSLTEQLSEYLPQGGIQRQSLNDKGFAELLTRAVELAALRATVESELTPVPLLGCRYRDGEHQMLTVTALLTDEGLGAAISSDMNFGRWPFRSTSWQSLWEINIPQMSAKERLTVNQLLKETSDAFEIHKALQVQFDDRQDRSIALLKNYVSHYRRVPSFGRIM